MSNETLACRARAYIAAMPPAISGQHGHDATFAVAKKLIHDFGMSETEAWPIFLDYNARCWNEDELRHKLEGAGNLTRQKKTRGHLRGEIAKSMPPVGQAVPWTKTPAPLPKRVQQEAVPPLVIVGPDSQEPPKDQTKANIKDKEHIDWFLEEAIIREDGALCAFHYLFDCYRKWRASYGLLATQLDQAQFAAEMQSQLRAKTLP
jgi:hypothetical protein